MSEFISREPSADFIREIVGRDVDSGRVPLVVTRFPPEPNGYLHIGHAKSICLNFGVAAQWGGRCHLRFDDTNPAKEDRLYVDSIIEDVRWLGFDWGSHLYYASDYFEQLYGCALRLIELGKAYVCSLTPDEVRAYRGTPTAPGQESPYRDRPVAENLELFRKMRAGEFADGTHVLRAKIDMASPNLHMRDPALYRIRKVHHHRTGDAWCIYPMYDFAHCLSDSIEGITHSLCTLEFEEHRPLYDWILDALEVHHPRQIEFARLNLSHTVMSKRRLLELVQEGLVDGWDDPRLPTLSGLRRRGYTPGAIRAFCARVGIAKRENVIELALLEHFLRRDLEENAPRALTVLRPLKVVIENYPEGRTEELDARNHPARADMGTRCVPFTRELFIERDDFREDPPRQFHRLAPGREVRLRYAYLIRCREAVRDPGTGEIIELRCTYDPATRGGETPDGRRVKGTLHWVSAAHALRAEARLYDVLFQGEAPEAGAGDPRAHLNPRSLEVVPCLVEPSLGDAAPGARFQFERLGYFCVDTRHSRPGAPVFNRTVGLRDSWAKIEAGLGRPG